MDIERNRQDKIEQLYQEGINPYPNHYHRKDTIEYILSTHFIGQEVKDVDNVQTAGRVMHKRPMGKAGFVHICDASGQIQIYTNDKLLSKKDYFVFQQLDIGDIIGVNGEPFYTKTGEASIRAQHIQLLSKNLSSLPIVKEKEGVVYDIFKDIESRYRKRYVDLLVNPAVRDIFILRSNITQCIRTFFIDRKFLEVETPMMQAIASGASAKPFETYHNALNMPLYLRIAPELYLKRLIVGGFEKVFEMNRNFRNEGISTKHNPEFTMVELYQAYADYRDMMSLVENLFSYICTEVMHSYSVPYGDHTIIFQKEWPRKRYLEAIHEATGLDFSVFVTMEFPDMEEIKCMVKPLSKLLLESCHTFGDVVDKVFSKYVEPTLIQPTFITHFPKAISPLAKECPDEKGLVERFELYIVGQEIGNAFSELNDPIEQEKRFASQKAMHSLGSDEAMNADMDFVNALAIGMPPTGGLGMGIDRIIMLFANQSSIKDVILFPTLKPNI